MPGPTIDQAFKTKFNDDLHLTYRQKSSKFRGLVRTDGQVNGSSVRFYKLGFLSATAKARNGEIPAQDPDMSFVSATMADRYVRADIDQLDLTKLSVDVRSGYVQAAASAFGNETDDTIINAMNAGATTASGAGLLTTAQGWSKSNALIAARIMDMNNVPDDGMRFCCVTPHGWSQLMGIDQFVRSDYIGPEDLPFKRMGIEIRSWNRFHWFQSPRLPNAGLATAVHFFWHLRAVGHGINAEVQTDWQWEAKRWNWTMAGAMSMGAVVIDATGAFKATLDDTAAIT